MRVASLLKAAPLFAAAVFSFSPQTAAADNCTLSYVIQPGDTLGTIAQAAYGNGNYQLIFSRNIGAVKDLRNLEPGATLMIPCDNGVEPSFEQLVAEQAAATAAVEAEETAEAEAEATAEVEVTTEAEATAEATTEVEMEAEVEAEPAQPTETAAVSPPDEAEQQPEAEAEAPSAQAELQEPSPQAEEAQPEADPQEPSPQAVVATAAPATLNSPVDKLKLLTASGLAPFSDQSLRGGGMATELANRSLEKLGIKDASRIVFIDDRDSHLQDLLIDGSFDLGYPWFRPACEQIAALEEMAPQDAWLCRTFIFSEPFYEFVYGFFVQKGEYSLSRTTFEDFAEARICRPAGASVMDLAVRGVREEDATFIRPETLEECFALLQAGEVDAVSGEAFEAENLLASLDLFDVIEELPNLGLLQTVHAVAPIGKPGADDAIAALNTGLIELKVSGEWFRIVGRHLAKN